MNHYLAIDQWGRKHFATGATPRQAYLTLFGRKHADKMFIDRRPGETRHIGYIIAGLWLSPIFRLDRWDKPA